MKPNRHPPTGMFAWLKNLYSMYSLGQLIEMTVENVCDKIFRRVWSWFRLELDRGWAEHMDDQHLFNTLSIKTVI